MLAFHKGLVALVSILFIGLGIWLMLDPLTVESLYPMQLEQPMAVSEVRAVFGGLMGGVGVGVLWLIWGKGCAMEGGAVMLFVFGGLLVARIAGLVGEGMPHGPVLNETIFETVVFFLMLATTFAIRNRE